MAKFIPYEISGRGSRGMRLFEPTPETISGIEQYIRWCENEVPQFMQEGMDLLCFTMAMVNQGIARKMSFGPYDPSGKRSELAWRTPAEGIRRISQRYYLGWKVQRKGPAHWRLFNDSREAYFIEFGISQVGGSSFGSARYVPKSRIRRPVRKLSLKKTLEYMMRTQAYHRIWSDIYANPKKRHRGKGFTQVVQSPPMGSFTGPMLGRYLP